MTTWIWTPGTVGNWFAEANWTADPAGPTGTPQAGDTAVIGSGGATIGAFQGGLPDVDGVHITLGGETNTGEPVRLRLVEAALGKPLAGVTISVASGADGPVTPLAAVIDVLGTSSITQGRLYVAPQRGELTIAMHDAADGSPGVLQLLDGAGGSGADTLVTVAQQSTLTLRGGTLENDGFIQIEGVARFAAGTSITGTGVIEVENGGSLRINGAVGAGQSLALPDGLSTLVLADPAAFSGTLQFGGAPGTRIDLRGIDAATLGVADGTLTLYDTGGATLASFAVELINPNTLDPLPQALSAADFVLRDLGDGGTRLLFAPAGPTILTTSLPVPVVATPGTLVDLADILLAAFGTATPDFAAMTLLPTTNSSEISGYWGQPVNGEAMVKPTWMVNGFEILAPTVVQAGDTIQLLVGNNVADPPQFMAQLTPVATGEDAVFMTYNLWSVAAAIPAPSDIGHPVPQDIIDAANAYASAYPGVVNTELCNWIADNIAAAAWATMPFPNASLSPEQNLDGGFWRVVHRGSDDPVTDWGALVQGGDIVRLQWTTQSGHTTTVLGAVGTNGEITVYDNIGPAAPKGNNPQGNTTAVHEAEYWTMTTPDGITIYRLDPEQQYLIAGTRKGEFIQGSVFDDLITPLGGGDTIALGPGADEIQGLVRDLRNTVVQGFGADDVLDLTDLDPTTASVRLRGEKLQVFSAGDRVATIELAGIAPGASFTLSADGSGGTLIALDTVLV